jgi:hypothetical protein
VRQLKLNRTVLDEDVSCVSGDTEGEIRDFGQRQSDAGRPAQKICVDMSDMVLMQIFGEATDSMKVARY